MKRKPAQITPVDERLYRVVFRFIDGRPDEIYKECVEGGSVAHLVSCHNTPLYIRVTGYFAVAQEIDRSSIRLAAEPEPAYAVIVDGREVLRTDNLGFAGDVADAHNERKKRGNAPSESVAVVVPVSRSTSKRRSKGGNQTPKLRIKAAPTGGAKGGAA